MPDAAIVAALLVASAVACAGAVFAAVTWKQRLALAAEAERLRQELSKAAALSGSGARGESESDSERIRTEEELREVSRRLETAVSAGRVGLWEWDIPSNRVYFSPEWKKQLGYQDHEIPNEFEEWLNRVHPDDLDPTLRRIQAAFVEHQLFNQVEFRMRHKDGSYRWILAQAAITRDDSGQPLRSCGAHVDITERKQAEESLRASEEIHRALIETLPDIVVRFDREGRHLFASHKVKDLYGIEPDQVLGKPFRDLGFGGDACQQFEETIRRVFKGSTTFETEFRVQGADGTYTYNLRGIPEKNAEGKVQSVLCLMRDITAYRKAEHDYRTLFNEMLNGFALHEIILGPDGEPADYRYIAVNPAFERMTGLRGEEILGRTVLEVMPGTEKYWIETYGRVAVSGSPVHFEHVSSELSKLFEVTAFRPAKNQFACIFADITERQVALSALRDSAARFRGIVDNTQAGYFFIDSEGCFRHVNTAWLQMHGYDAPEEILGKHYSVTQESAELPVSNRIVERLLAGQAVPDGEISRLCRDGTVGYHTYTARPVIQGGEVIGLEGFLIDTTDRRRAEEHRAKLEQQLRQSQKMEAIGHLAGGVAHDFNNLLQVIFGNVDLMQGHSGTDRTDNASLSEVRKAAQRAADLTRQLLAFSRRQVMQPVSFDLNDLVEGVLKMIRRIIGEHIELVFRPASLHHTVYADKGQIEQVLMNLCVNARDAMPSGGRLLIETEHVEIEKDGFDADMEVAKGSYDVLVVSDTGHGMDETTRSQIFEPFFTTKTIGQGTGLGLATVYGIVKQHNGYILVSSEPGSGSTFRIYLPSSTEEKQESELDYEKEAPGGSETILLAEDEEDVRKLVRKLLQGVGYNVLVARDGEEALDVYEKYAAAIDLVMLDAIMPRLGGQQTMQRIRELNPRTRFLFSSGYSADSLHKGFRLESGVRLMPKPYTREALLHAVREALDAPEAREEAK